MACDILVGGQWGDEGKAKIIDAISQDYNMVVRYQGGANAGHTVIVDGTKHIFHLIPSGILHPHITCVLGNGVVVDLEALLSEIQTLKQQGIAVEERLKISSQCFLVLPHHKALDKVQEGRRQENNIGTTRRGIGPAYVDKVGRQGVRLSDLKSPSRVLGLLESLAAERNVLFKELYGSSERLDPKALATTLSEQYRAIKPFLVEDSPALFDEALESGKKLLLEGAQGIGLDLDFGSYPYVTSSSTGVGGALSGTGIGVQHVRRVIGVFKTYVTRVGEGFLPTLANNNDRKTLQTQGGEFGSTTGRPRECGWFDVVQARHAIRTNGISDLALTKLDVLDTMSPIKACTKYLIDGIAQERFPTDAESFQQAKPHYEVFPGWRCETSGVGTFDALPSQARDYLKFLEDALERPITYLSNGPERTALLQPSK